MNTALPLLAPPLLPLRALDTLWIQIMGTRCNIACRHCLVSAGPRSERLAPMSVDAVRAAIAEGVALGVREYYFTGGEPFMHADIMALIEETLRAGPLTILTNGLFFDDDTCARLARLFAQSEHSLDLRVSIDGTTAVENDPVRGKGTFAGITAGLRALAAHGLSPVLTLVAHDDTLGTVDARARFLQFARDLGFSRPRVKVLPLLRVGREPRRTRDYHAEERVTSLTAEDAAALQCGSARAVTAEGVFPCPILVLDPYANLGKHLADALGPVPLRAAACYTCQTEGLSCRT